MKTILGFSFLLLLISCFNDDQFPDDKTVFEGKVVYDDTEEPAEGVLVKLSSNRRGSSAQALIVLEDSVVLDSSGQFHFEEPYQNMTHYSLRARYLIPGASPKRPENVSCEPSCDVIEAGNHMIF